MLGFHWHENCKQNLDEDSSGFVIMGKIGLIEKFHIVAQLKATK